MYTSILENIENIENKFNLLEKSIVHVTEQKEHINLGDYIQSKIQYNLQQEEELLQKKLVKIKTSTCENDSELLKLEKQLINLRQTSESTTNKIKSLAWGNALKTTSNIKRKIIKLHSNINSSKDKYQTIIIDEAQDVPNSFIELTNYFAKQIILAGDEAQKENPNGVGNWSNLREKINFFSEKTLSAFRLRHNFRQTYELGNLSYNYRQLILGNAIEDLEGDYFDNQKGFNVPSIANIDKLNKLIENKLNYISDNFTQTFPLTLIVSDSHSKEEAKNNLVAQGFNVSFDERDITADIIIINVNQIAGREFPVVISMLTNSMNESTVYIILSRAKFDLTLIVTSEYKTDSHLETLKEFNMLSDLN